MELYIFKTAGLIWCNEITTVNFTLSVPIVKFTEDKIISTRNERSYFSRGSLQFTVFVYVQCCTLAKQLFCCLKLLLPTNKCQCRGSRQTEQSTTMEGIHHFLLIFFNRLIYTRYKHCWSYVYMVPPAKQKTILSTIPLLVVDIAPPFGCCMVNLKGKTYQKCKVMYSGINATSVLKTQQILSCPIQLNEILRLQNKDNLQPYSYHQKLYKLLQKQNVCQAVISALKLRKQCI